MNKLSKREFNLILVMIFVLFFVFIFNFVCKPMKKKIDVIKNELETQTLEKEAQERTIENVGILKNAIATLNDKLSATEKQYLSQTKTHNWDLDKELISLINASNCKIENIMFHTDPMMESTQELIKEENKLSLITMSINITGNKTDLTTLVNKLHKNTTYVFTNIALSEKNNEAKLSLNISIKSLSDTFVNVEPYIKAQYEELK